MAKQEFLSLLLFQVVLFTSSTVDSQKADFPVPVSVQTGIGLQQPPLGSAPSLDDVSSYPEGTAVSQPQLFARNEQQQFQIKVGTGSIDQTPVAGGEFINPYPSRSRGRSETEDEEPNREFINPFVSRARSEETKISSKGGLIPSDTSEFYNPYETSSPSESRGRSRGRGRGRGNGRNEGEFGGRARAEYEGRARSRSRGRGRSRANQGRSSVEEETLAPAQSASSHAGRADLLSIPAPLAITNEEKNPEYFPQPEPANEIIDVAVECDMERNRMSVTFTFQRDFDGVIYTKGNFKVEACRKVADRGRFQRFDIPLDRCGMDEKSGSDEFGGTASFTNTIVVMNELEWGVLEMWDKAYRVQCDFAGDSRGDSVNYGLTVPQLKADNVQGIMDLPTCRMKVVIGENPMVPPTNDLVLGEIASLVVYIKESTHYDVFVSNCYAHDGMDMSFLSLMDENGCPVHRKIIGKQQHTTDMAPGDTLVFAYFKTFKFPDVNNVFFECQCTLCMQNCFQPQCGARRKREIDANMEQAVGDTRAFQSVKVKLPTLGSFEITKEGYEAALNSALDVQSLNICVPKTGFTMGIIFLVLLITIIVVISFLLYRQRRNGCEAEAVNIHLKGIQ